VRDAGRMQPLSRLNLETSRLSLRPWASEDLPEFERISNDPEVADFTASFVYPQPPGWAQDRLNRQIAGFGGDQCSFAVVWRPTIEVVAEVNISIDQKRNRGDVGYMCAREWRGQGIVAEAVQAMKSWVFATHPGVNRIQAVHYPRNSASGRVLEKVGFQREGVLRGYVLKNGVSEDVIIYAITRADFNEGFRVA
jgi:[ribosomal protein S5]-alanine N-acetyltransferase